MPTLKGTTVTANKQTKLKDEDSVVITYTLNKGSIWSDGKKGNIKLTFTVKDLEIDVQKPTNDSKPLKFTGDNGSGTFVMPTLDGTVVTADKQTKLSKMVFLLKLLIHWNPIINEKIKPISLLY